MLITKNYHMILYFFRFEWNYVIAVILIIYLTMQITRMVKIRIYFWNNRHQELVPLIMFVTDSCQAKELELDTERSQRWYIFSLLFSSDLKILSFLGKVNSLQVNNTGFSLFCHMAYSLVQPYVPTCLSPHPHHTQPLLLDIDPHLSAFPI